MYMNINIKENSITLLLRLMTIVVIIKLIWIFALFFMPKDGIDKISIANKTFYDKYYISKSFGILNNIAIHSIPQTTPTYKLNNVKLMGLYVSKKNSFILVNDKKDTKIISKGDNFKGYILEKILQDKAIFIKNGKKYEIVLQKDNTGISSSVNTTADTKNENNDVVNFIRKKDITNYTRNIKNIWKDISIQEIVKKGKLKGFKVTRIAKNSILSRIGLRVGDIILGANGNIFHSYSEVLKLYKNIKNLDNIQLIILRNKQKKELEYAIY